MSGTGHLGTVVGRGYRILVSSARMQILQVRSHPAVSLTAIVQPAVYWLLVGLRGGHPGTDSVSLLVRILLTSLWGSALWAAGGILRREIGEGTLGRNLASLTDPRLVIIGKCLGSTLLVLGVLVCSGTVLALATGTPVSLGGIPLLIGGLLVVALSGTAMGFALSGIFVLTRHAVHVTALLTYPVYIFGGLILPLSMLPGPLTWPSRLVSLYWAAQFLTTAARGIVPPLLPLLALAALTSAYYLAGHLLFSRVVRRARVKGTIDLG